MREIDSELKIYKVYMVKNNLNGYKYIGITSMSLKQRMYGHINSAKMGDTSAFHLALSTFGKDNFSVSELASGLTYREAIELERYYIQKYRTYILFEDCEGYNSSLGGEGAKEGSDRQRMIFQYDSSTGDLLKVHKSLNSAEGTTGISRVSITNACDGKSISAGGFLWRRFKDATSSVEPQLCGRSRVVRKVAQYSKDGELLAVFESLEEAGKAVGAYSSSIAKVCRGKLKSTKGYIWRYIDNDEKPLKSIQIEESKIAGRIVRELVNNVVVREYNTIQEASETTGIPKSTLTYYIDTGKIINNTRWIADDKTEKEHPVISLSINTSIEYYKSITEAARQTGIARSAIIMCCNGKQLTAGGRTWKYAKNNTGG